MIRILFIALGLATLWLTGCITQGSKAARRANLSGDWEFEVTTGTATTRGAMTLVAAGNNYTGTLTTDQGNNVLPVRSLSLKADSMTLVVESPQGKVVFVGSLNPAHSAFNGSVTYHTGAIFPMRGWRKGGM